MGMRWRIADFFRRNALRAGLRNLWRWFPVIWQDRNFDHWFVYTILETKLRLQEQCLRENNLYVGVEEDCAVMRECIDLIGKLKEEKYEADLYAAHEDKWGEFSFMPERESEDGSALMRRVHPKALTPEECEQEQREMREVFEKADVQHSEARARLFALLRDNIEKWWD